MKNFQFIKLNNNEKTPIKLSTLTEGITIDKIDTKFYNIGLLAGANNLIILDIDDKDDGKTEWKRYTDEFGEPSTLKQTTPNSGFHYIFKFKEDDETTEQQQQIKKLKNKSKYRGKGIDIRTGKAYIVYTPSNINDKFYEIVNNVEPTRMPISLIKWLLEFEKIEKTNNLILINSLDEIKELLTHFKNVSSIEWMNMTTALKNLMHEYNDIDKKELKSIWDEWSKEQNGYNKNNNYKIFKNIKSSLNLNFIIYNYNLKHPKPIKPFNSFKPFEEETTPEHIKILEMNNKYIYDETTQTEQFSYGVFNNYKTIIIKSTTGTGKTSNTSKHIERYFKETTTTKYKFMSITSLISMTSQHVESFKNINALSYLNIEDDETLENNNIIICLNSLGRFKTYTDVFFKKYIVYIDEINSILNTLTNNEILNPYLKTVYPILQKIINNCYKLIVSDATVKNNLFYLLESRTKSNAIFINNTFKNFEGVKAYKMNNENEFYEIIKNRMINNEYFLFGCDSKNVIVKYYNELKQYSNNKSILITSEDKHEIGDANEYFKNKFVFYSPSITTGVDFTCDIKQDVFLFIKGSSITADVSYQQLSRTRNINNVYFFVSNKNSKEAVYNNINEVRETYLNYNIPEYLKNLTYNYINKKLVFDENEYFKLFIYNTYETDIFKTNNSQHFLNILKSKGFEIINTGNIKRINKETGKQMKQKTEDANDLKFEEHVKGDNINETLKKRITYLNLTEEQLNKYKELLLNKETFDAYLNFLILLKPENILKIKMSNMLKSTPEYKLYFNKIHKVLLIYELEHILNIQRFEITKTKTEDVIIKIPDEFLKKIKTTFRTTSTPTTYNECMKMYANLLKHMTKNLNIISLEQKRNNNIRTYVNSIDKDKINELLKLYEMKDPTRQYIIKNSIFYASSYVKPEEIINEPEFIEDTPERINEFFKIDDELYTTPDPLGLDFYNNT